MMSSRWHLTVALFCVFDVCLALEAEAGLTLNGKQQFYVGKEKVTRDEAVQLCQKKCMELVSIENSFMNLQLVELFIRNSINGALWTSGKQLIGADIKVPNLFPTVSNISNTVKSSEICIAISLSRNSFVLKTQSCGDKSGYICAMPPNQTQAEFYISEEMANPAQARKICSSKCMQLIRVNNQEENNAIYELLVREKGNDKLVFGTSARYWTTGHRGANENWKWSDDDPIKYYHWAKTEPNSKKRDPSCIEIYIQGNDLVWNDHYCSLKRKFICEKLKENE